MNTKRDRILKQIAYFRHSTTVCGPEAAMLMTTLFTELTHVKHLLSDIGKRFRRSGGQTVEEAIDAYMKFSSEQGEHLALLQKQLSSYVEAAAPFQAGGEFAHLGTIGESTVLLGLREGIKALRELKRLKAGGTLI